MLPETKQKISRRKKTVITCTKRTALVNSKRRRRTGTGIEFFQKSHKAFATAHLSTHTDNMILTYTGTDSLFKTNIP
jgi:hypothetical protein